MKNNKFNFRNLLGGFSVSKHAKIYACVPAVIVLVALIVMMAIGIPAHDFAEGVGVGIDFEGGTVLTVQLGEEAINNFDAHRTAITNEIEKNGVRVTYARLQEAATASNSSIEFRYKNISKDDNEINALNNQITEAVKKMYEDESFATVNNFVTYESIGATAAQDLLSKAAIALVVSVAIILVYIIIRFTLMSGFAAIIALIHDVVIMFCLTVICRVQINSSFVAAMITIIAYSINNTIIIFDRCREYVKPLKGKKNIDYVGIGDMAVRETMTRSVYTTLTTMVTVIFLAILGGESIRQFCVPIILGLVAGFYSSVFLATPLWSALSISFDKTKEKYMKRNSVSYDDKTDDSVGTEQVNLASSASELKPRSTKQAGQKGKQNNNTIHKYSKKNTTFKKK